MGQVANLRPIVNRPSRLLHFAERQATEIACPTFLSTCATKSLRRRNECASPRLFPSGRAFAVYWCRVCPTGVSIPLSTYRLQLRPEFDFEAAAQIVEYLCELGISHLYCSPYLQAAPGSTHGYDTVDYHQVSAELGGEEGRLKLVRKLAEYGLGQVLDIVPNHMAITGPQNRWWWDTLENGEASRYAPYFDIDWNAPEERLRNKILLPVLGDHYGKVLAAGGNQSGEGRRALYLSLSRAYFPRGPGFGCGPAPHGSGSHSFE